MSDPHATPARPGLARRLAERCAERERASLLRRARSFDWTGPTEVRSDGRTLAVFCSNDYLGLARDPTVTEALRRGADAGAGSTASQLVCGRHREHALLEEELAAWTGRDQTLLFSTGYMANLGAVQALLERGDLCVQDRLNHASLLDAAQLS